MSRYSTPAAIITHVSGYGKENFSILESLCLSEAFLQKSIKKTLEDSQGAVGYQPVGGEQFGNIGS
jgi:hypothetical protein